MDHENHGIRRCHSSPAVSDGGVDELRQNRAHNNSNRQNQLVQELGLRRSPMGDGVPVYHSVAELSVRCTEYLRHTGEQENTIVHR